MSEEFKRSEKELKQQAEGEPEEEQVIKKKAFFEKFLRMYKKIFVRTVTSATTRTPHCKHKIASCYMSALDGFLKGFFYGALVKAGIAFAFTMLKRKNFVKSFMNMFKLDTAVFAMFTGGYIGGFRAVQCALRKYRNTDDAYNRMIANFLASAALAFDRSKSRRITIAIYTFARCVESFVKVMDHHKIMTERKWWPILLMNVLHIYIAVTWYFDIDHFPPGLNKPIERITGAKPNDYIIIEQICRAGIKRAT